MKTTITFSSIGAAIVCALALASCGGGGGDRDAAQDATLDTADGRDGAADDGGEGTDGDAVDGLDGATDGDPQTDGDAADAAEEEAAPSWTVVHCADLAPPSSGTCAVTPGSGAKLIEGNVLEPARVLVGGQVLVSGAGAILCVDCDCAGMAEATGATVVACADGLVSPGFINAHDHMTFTQNEPADWGDERYEHRHDWRRGLRGHTRIPSSGGASAAEMQWGELRQVMAGTTSIAGSGGAAGFLRNLDRGTLEEGLGQDPVEYQTFPLGDSRDATLLTANCNYPAIDPVSVLDNDCYMAHVSEGIDAPARNEFLCVSSTDRGGVDLTEQNSAFVHMIGTLAPDGGEMAASGASVIWSPRSNVSLYGNTTPVTMYHREGVRIALGTDWTVSGSMNMLRELACAASLNDTYYGGFFEDRELWLMATSWAAGALAVDDATGALRAGLAADIAVIDGAGSTDYYDAAIHAPVEAVVLVLRGGLPLYGDADVMAAIPGGQTGCERLPGEVCSVAKTACVQRETGMAFAQLQAANTGSYTLFACGTPLHEPTCVPKRAGEYTGEITADDGDGDGIPDASDNCPTVFNPVRPLDDATEPYDPALQADSDGDGAGDLCDPCPLDPGTTTCTPPDPDDRDRDGVANASDNCPSVANPFQEDGDTDGHGDACDACPAEPNPGSRPCPASIYDIKQGVVAPPADVAVSGVVTAVAPPRFFVQVPEDERDATLGASYSGIYVYVPSSNPAGLTLPVQGDEVIVSGTVQLFYGQLQVSSVTEVQITSAASALPPAAVALTTEVCTGCAKALAYEGVLVRVEDGAVSELEPAPGSGDTSPTNEYILNNDLRVNDLMYLTSPFPAVDDVLTVTGVLRFANGNSKLEPRDADDIVFGGTGDPKIRSLGPSPVFVDQGAVDAQATPPLTVRLMGPAPTGGATVGLSSGAPGTLGVPATVAVPAGAVSATIPVTGVAGSATPVTVTATLGTTSAQAQVVVVATGRVPAPVAASPASATILVGQTLTVRVTLDVPARTGGTTVTVAPTGAGAVTAAATLAFPAGALTADLPVTGATAGPVTLTFSTTAGSTTAAITVSDRVGTMLISEYLEGSSYNKAIEVYNGSAATVSLATCALKQYTNGSTSGTTIALGSADLAPGEVFVICATRISDSTFCDMTTGSLTFNGNDAVELVCGGAAADVFGQIGFDPGTAWGTGGVSTKDHTLRRSCEVFAGDADGSDAFDPSVEWTGFAIDSFDGLGVHCP